MKALTKIILLSLLCVIALHAGESSTAKIFPEYVPNQANWIDSFVGILQDKISTLMQRIFNNVSNLLHNGVVYTIFIVAVMLSLLQQLKNGYPTRDEIFKFAKWIVVTSIILAIFSSYEAFKSFLGYCTIPASWVLSSLNGIFSTGGTTPSQMIIEMFNDAGRIGSISFDKAYPLFNGDGVVSWIVGKVTFGASEFIASVATAIFLFPTWLMVALFWIVGIFLTCILIGSLAIATLLLSFSPMLVPLLGLPFLKPYFYSWLKLWITYTLYAPISLFVASIATQSLTELRGNEPKIENIVTNATQWADYITPMISCILCIYLLKKIPTWISQVLGVQGESAGTGIGATATSAVAGATAVGMAAKALGTSTFGKAFTNALPGAKSATAIGGAIGKGAMNYGSTIANSFKQGLYGEASAGKGTYKSLADQMEKIAR